MRWPDDKVLALLGIKLPILQAPMAGSSNAVMAIAVAKAGGLGSIPCGMLSPDQIRAEVSAFRKGTDAPVNLNFFCHEPPEDVKAQQQAWLQKLTPYYKEYGIEPSLSGGTRAAFDDTLCALVEELEPEIVSFHFGLPTHTLVTRVKKTGAKILSSATSVKEAVWLEENGCDAVIAQGYEAGGHRAMFLETDITKQPGTMALVPQIADAVSVPVIASGGIADGRGIAASFLLGASAVQIGTAYLFCPESLISPLYRAGLEKAADADTVITNLFSGCPARGIVNRFIRECGPMNDEAPPFPMASQPLSALRAKVESMNDASFSPLWAGQAAQLVRHDMDAKNLTLFLAENALKALKSASA